MIIINNTWRLSQETSYGFGAVWLLEIGKYYRIQLRQSIDVYEIHIND